MSKKKVIGWNVNQRSGLGKAIPEIVVEELILQNADIVILTEVMKNNEFLLFEEKMRAAGYELATSRNKNTNEVCILWKKDYGFVAVDDSLISAKNNDNPNYLRVTLKDEEENEFNVVGYRICVGSNNSQEYQTRARQMKIVGEKLNEINKPALVVTDSNNLRRGTTIKHWNLVVLDEMLGEVGFKRYTPKGSSIFSAHPDLEENEFAEDHIITNNMMITDLLYDRSFTKRDPEIYKWGENFTERIEGSNYYKQIKVGYPDHAIVAACFEIV